GRGGGWGACWGGGAAGRPTGSALPLKNFPAGGGGPAPAASATSAAMPGPMTLNARLRRMRDLRGTQQTEAAALTHVSLATNGGYPGRVVATDIGVPLDGPTQASRHQPGLVRRELQASRDRQFSGLLIESPRYGTVLFCRLLF